MSSEAKADQRQEKIYECMTWSGLTFQNSILLCRFEKITTVLHAVFKASREDANNIEQVPRVLKGLLDFSFNEDLTNDLSPIN